MQYPHYPKGLQIRLLPAGGTVLVISSHEVLVKVFHSYPQGEPR